MENLSVELKPRAVEPQSAKLHLTVDCWLLALSTTRELQIIKKTDHNSTDWGNLSRQTGRSYGA